MHFHIGVKTGARVRVKAGTEAEIGPMPAPIEPMRGGAFDADVGERYHKFRFLNELI